MRKNPLVTIIFLGFGLNLLLAPAVYAVSGEEITRKAAYAIGLLSCVVLGLSIYLFVVIFQPERF